MTISTLRSAAKYARSLLVAGLVAGIVFPDLALFMKDYIGPLIAALLFLNAFRIGHKSAVGTRSDIGTTFGLVLFLQLLVPCILLLVLFSTGTSGALATALVIMAAGPSISGSVNITNLLRHDPAPSLRLLILGTALLPLTIVPVFFLSPDLGSPELVASTAFRLLIIIAVSTGLAFLARHFLDSKIEQKHLEAVDGLSIIAMSVVVIGLMSALGPALFSAPRQVAIALACAFGANLFLQILFYFLLSAKRFEKTRVGISVVAGNRNMALFLTALPASVTEPLLLFIACYQLPMYLTPIIMSRIYKPLE